MKSFVFFILFFSLSFDSFVHAEEPKKDFWIKEIFRISEGNPLESTHLIIEISRRDFLSAQKNIQDHSFFLSNKDLYKAAVLGTIRQEEVLYQYIELASDPDFANFYPYSSPFAESPKRASEFEIFQKKKAAWVQFLFSSKLLDLEFVKETVLPFILQGLHVDYYSYELLESLLSSYPELIEEDERVHSFTQLELSQLESKIQQATTKKIKNSDRVQSYIQYQKEKIEAFEKLFLPH